MWENVKRLVNLTPHEMAFWVPDGIIRIPTSGKVVRLNSYCEPEGEVMGIPVLCCKEGEPFNLPEPEEGTVYLVSSLVAKKVHRDDVLCPDTSDDGAIKSDNRVVAVKRLQRFV